MQLFGDPDLRIVGISPLFTPSQSSSVVDLSTVEDGPATLELGMSGSAPAPSTSKGCGAFHQINLSWLLLTLALALLPRFKRNRGDLKAPYYHSTS
jgi:hypothetical protein